MNTLIKTYPSRVKMLELVKQHGKVCELGVFKGDFAEIIATTCKPEELVLIDHWPETVRSGDVDGNNIEQFKGEYLHTFVTQRFKQLPHVNITKATSAEGLAI